MIPAYMQSIIDADAANYANRISGWHFAPYAVEPYRWARMKYHVAQLVWNKRERPCGLKDEEGRPLSWRRRFFEMFWEPLPQYVGRIRKAQKALPFPIARTGSDAAQSSTESAAAERAAFP